MFDLVFIEQDSLALPKLIVGGGSNPTRINASLGFEFQESVEVLYKQSDLPRSRIVLFNLVFVHFVNLQDSVTLRETAIRTSSKTQWPLIALSVSEK